MNKAKIKQGFFLKSWLGQESNLNFTFSHLVYLSVCCHTAGREVAWTAKVWKKSCELEPDIEPNTFVIWHFSKWRTKKLLFQLPWCYLLQFHFQYGHRLSEGDKHGIKFDNFEIYRTKKQYQDVWLSPTRTELLQRHQSPLFFKCFESDFSLFSFQTFSQLALTPLRLTVCCLPNIPQSL